MTRKGVPLGVATVLLPAVLALGGAPSSSAAVRGGPPTAELAGCHLAIVEMLDDSARLAAFVADPFTVAEFYGPGTGALSLWHFSCEGIAAGNQQPRPAQLVLASVQIDPPDGELWPAYVIRPAEEQPGAMLYYLHTFDFYLQAAYSDHPSLVNMLRRAGIPIAYVRDLAFERAERFADPVGVLTDPLQWHTAHTQVPGRSGNFGFTVSPTKQHPPHDHNNGWYSSTYHGVIEMRLELLDAIDKWCSYGLPDCADVRADADAADFLGAPHRTDGLGIDHDRIPAGRITLRSFDG